MEVFSPIQISLLKSLPLSFKHTTELKQR
jgi:hypothetical protein